MLKQDIIREATRLTRAGQLVEATALLQRMFRGDTAPDETYRTTGRIALRVREPLVIDARANAVDETDRTQAVPTCSTQPRVLHGYLDRDWKGIPFGLRDVSKRAPQSTRDIVPEGARFEEGIYSNPAGSRSYKLFIPSGYQGQPLPLVV